MPSIPLYRSAELRRIEAAAADQDLMRRAGRAAADLASALCRPSTVGAARILVLAGPGNNGGDAFVAALHLRAEGAQVTVVFPGDAARLPVDARAAYRRYVDAGGTTQSEITPDARWSLIIDGLFGIGLTRPLDEPYAGLIEQANTLAARHRCPLLALDVPSGLDADTGVGQRHVIRASHTLTFLAAKPGLLTADGPDQCGTLSVTDLDLPLAQMLPACGHSVAPALFAEHLRPRRANTHKGTFGNAGILGGARGMVGAALLAGRAALKLGSGRVYVGLLDEYAPALDLQQPELMMRTPGKLLGGELTALACGPGMGLNHDAGVLLETVCAMPLPLVLDADALNLIAGEGNLHVAVATRRQPTLLTPHPAEAGRLLDCDSATIQADRLGAALELAARYNALVALKGCGTVIATPAGAWFVNTSGNAGLATAGSGDVLTGLLTALLAQHWPPLAALLAAVHVHGLAAEAAALAGVGPVGLTAGELIDSARACFNRWLASPTGEP